MGLYRRFVRSKKGMSAIFGGLFFIILILMGFNVMLWGFVQWDAYNRVIATMSQRDQQSASENIVPVNSTYSSGSGTFTVIVNNLGGSSVNIAQIYISNVNTTGGCQPTPCYAPASFTYTNGNIPAGSVNFQIRISGFTPASGTQYHITLASARGRLFTLYYPWKFNSQTIINNGGGGNFVTNVGPLAIYFDFRSFNYTVGGTGTCSGIAPNPSCGAFCMPTVPVVLYVRVQNTVQDAPVTILTQTGMEAQAYGVNGFGQFAQAWLLDPGSINPSSEAAYSYSTNPYVLQTAGANNNNPASFAVLKIGAPNPGTSGAVTFSNVGRTWITFIGIYYYYHNIPQGETIPFMDFYTNSPNCVN